MNYYLDTEFLEGPQTKRTFGIPHGKTKPTIDLISIGILAEDGREYYAISKDFNLREAWDRWQWAEPLSLNMDELLIHAPSEEEIRNRWVEQGTTMYKSPIKSKKEDAFKPSKLYWIRENVLKSIFFDLAWDDFHLTHFKDRWLSDDKEEAKEIFINDGTYCNNLKWFKSLLAKYGKSNKQIAEEVKEFVAPADDRFDGHYGWVSVEYHIKKFTPTFYAYFADYDWVAFCWLFGKMIDLPKGFPMYCRDLKQELDSRVQNLNWGYVRHTCSTVNNLNDMNHLVSPEKDRDATFGEKMKKVKSLIDYPKQTNEHNALADARWNKELHKFIKSL